MMHSGLLTPIFVYVITKQLCNRITDEEAVAMSRYIVKHDGLFLGSSSACNLFAAVKLAKSRGWKNKETIVTIL